MVYPSSFRRPSFPYLFPRRNSRANELDLSKRQSQIRRPSISFGPKNLYLQAPPQLEAATRPNLEKPLGELFTSRDVLTVTDAGLPFSLNLSVKFA